MSDHSSRHEIASIRADETLVLSAPSKEESASAKEEKDYKDDEDRVGVHESGMPTEHEDRIEQRMRPRPSQFQFGEGGRSAKSTMRSTAHVGIRNLAG